LIHADCFAWLEGQPENSIHACVTDPPYGVVEYTPKQVEKLRAGKGGVWRIPPSFDGHQRSPLPRFTTLSWSDRIALEAFFERLARLLRKVLVPGANVLMASNPLLAHLITTALESGAWSRADISRG
jgi:site-specific DNA-methyltransferase (adenine-specific)